MDRADRRSLGIAVAMLAALACGDPIDVAPIDAAADMDGTVTPTPDAATSGLRVRLSTSPRIPGDYDDDGVTGSIGRADFDLRDLRVVGDVGTVQAAALNLRFRGDPETFEIGFGQAQPGVYGTFAAEVTHVDIRGTIDRSGGDDGDGGDGGDDEIDFRIVDDPPQGLDVTAALGGVALGAGQLVTIDIEIDIEDLMSEVDWSVVEPEDDGELRIDSDDPQIGKVRVELGKTFKQKD